MQQQPSDAKIFPAICGAVLTILLVLILTFGLHALGDSYSSYGEFLFILSPCLGGALAVIVYNRHGINRFWRCVGTTVISGVLACLSLIALGLEGLICVAMALPIVVPLFMVGGILGYLLSKLLNSPRHTNTIALFLVALVPLLTGFTDLEQVTPKMRKATTKVIINGTPAAVWRELVAFSEIPPPSEFTFRLGIAYPIRARIEGHGVGAIRYCEFSTGAFVEPITHWEENKRLAFDVLQQPVPMFEISPYDIHPPHLDSAVQSQRGEFLIIDLGNGQVELTGNTWYRIAMEPEPYWGWLSDSMIHLIHKRVLNHIKNQVESQSKHAPREIP